MKRRIPSPLIYTGAALLLVVTFLVFVFTSSQGVLNRYGVDVCWGTMAALWILVQLTLHGLAKFRRGRFSSGATKPNLC